MADKNKHLILTFFDSEQAADNAVESLKNWDKANKDIKLGAIGVLVKDEQGRIKTHKIGKRDTAIGAEVGVVLGIIAGVLSGGIAILGGIIYGVILGGIIGAFIHQGLGLSQEDLKRIGDHLDAGHAAVGVLVEKGEVSSTTDELTRLGGKVETHEVTAEALKNATQAATSVQGSAAAAPEKTQ
jgi:uncharacterized membrane protein